MHLTARAAEDAALDLSVELVLEAVAFVVDSFEQGLDVLVGQSVGREGGHRDQGRDDERACRCHEPEGSNDVALALCPGRSCLCWQS